MADLYDILNSGILNNWKPEQNRAKFGINISSIKSSVPNNDVLKLKNMIKGGARNLGILSTAVPFYKDFAVPVGKDMYNFIQGNPDKSKLLKFAIDMINGGKDSNANTPNDLINQLQQGNGVVPFEEITPPQTDVSDLQNIGAVVTPSRNRNMSTYTASNKQSTANSESNIVNNEASIQPTEDVDVINNYLSRLRGINRPYIKALESYLNNYNKNLDQARRADLYFYGANLAKGLDPRAGQKFNPLQNQMDIINVIKALQDAKAGDMSSVDELAGNVAIAQQIGLPPQAAFANKNLLSALTSNMKYQTDLEKARIIDAMRRYGYDSAYSRAIMQQLLRNQGSRENALIYSAPNYTSPEDAVEILNSLGIDIGNIQQQPQGASGNKGKQAQNNSAYVNDDLFIK